MLCLRLLFIMVRWELMRTLYERGVTQRLILPQMIFLIWLVVSGAFLPWMLQLHQIVLGLLLAQSSMLVLIRIADSFAGERERSTLEVLLLSPVPDWILVAGKALGLLAVALLSFGAAMLFYGIVAVLFTPSAPAVAWFATAFLLGLMVLLTLINVGLMVSWRAPSVQAAQQMLLYPPVGAAASLTMDWYTGHLSVIGLTGVWLAVSGGVTFRRYRRATASQEDAA